MNKKNSSIARSSATEYLTFVAAGGSGGVEAVYADENVWLTQKMLGKLYNVETHTINYHLKRVFSDSELEEASVIRNFRITAADGKRRGTGMTRTTRTKEAMNVEIGKCENVEMRGLPILKN
ncbi:MAG: hypothetical protein M0Q53_10775 [Prolixibacteraceae bacterium]|jgi:hypothetical protein|nr:hypothetical protein [Prolixibacteraceae bacterium]